MTTAFVAETTNRVAQATADHVNQRIQWTTEAAVLHFGQRLDEIESRLHQLNQEWDIERALEATAGVVISTTLLLGLLRKRWRLLSMVSSGFLVYHAIAGWCPPLPILRRLGVRTGREINREKYALKAIRGDFTGAGPDTPGEPAEKARAAAAAVLDKFSLTQPPNVYAYEEPLNVQGD